VALWDETEAAFIEAQQTVTAGKRLSIGAGLSRAGKSPRWRIAVDEDLVSDGTFDRAGTALASLAQALPLIRKPRDGVVEYLRAECPGSEFFVSVESLPDESAFVRMLVRAADAIDFAASRRWRGRPRSPWDTACRRRLVRRDPRDHICVIEPGVVWFVDWLENVGAETIYSCEGHPHDFHVVFRAPYALAHCLASVPNAMVEIFRSVAFPQPDQWRLYLRQDPRDRSQRDDFVRRLAEALTVISLPSAPV
jgi:hypothetical protein